MIEARGLSKRFGAVTALSGLGLTVSAGERVALVGPSGCGKTTALRLIAGLDIATAGSLVIGGVDATSPRALPPHRRGLGYVPQGASLFPTMDVAGNVAYGLSREDRGRTGARVRELLEAFGLSELAERMPHELSGGQARRVALARAMAPAPRRLLLDEPLVNLDAAACEDLLGEIDRALRASGASLLYVTHDMSEAERLGARVVRMEGPGE